MDFKAQLNWLFYEVFMLIIRPQKFWKTKLHEGFRKNAFALIFVPCLLLLFVSVISGKFLFLSEFDFYSAAVEALRVILILLFSLFGAIFIINKLAISYKGNNSPKMLKTILIYCFVPYLLAHIVAAFTQVAEFQVAGLYGLYLFVVSAQYFMGIPEKKQSKFISLAVLLLLLIIFLVSFIISNLFDSIF
ncbi:MAG: YIP1 family protein [Mangrovibacterium sp.]